MIVIRAINAILLHALLDSIDNAPLVVDVILPFIVDIDDVLFSDFMVLLRVVGPVESVVTFEVVVVAIVVVADAEAVDFTDKVVVPVTLVDC